MRTIDNINRAKITNNVYINTLSANQPLLITDNNNSSSTISIKGLNNFGTTNQIIQVNSAGDGLEYTDKFLEASGGTLKVKSNTAYNYFQIKQDSSATAGFQLTNEYSVTGTTQNAYLYLDPTTNNLNIESNGERIKFANTDIKFINSRDREMLFYDNSEQRLILNDNADKIFIRSCNLIEVGTGRRFYEHTPATNLITIGNPQDTISIVNGSATISLPTSNTALVGTDTQQTLTNKTLTSPIISTISNGGATLTLPTTTGTIALTSQIVSDIFEKDTTSTIKSIVNIDKSSNAPRYIKMLRNTNVNDTGFWVSTNNNGTIKDAYMFLTSNSRFNIQTTSNILKFYNNATFNFDIENPRDRKMFRYTDSNNRLTIGSTDTDFVYIDRCSNILVDDGRRFMESSLTNNTLTIGNGTDTITIFNGTSSSLNELTLPLASGTLALTNDILFQVDGSSIRPKVLTNTYIQNKRNTSANSGFRATNTYNSAEQSIYFFLDSTSQKCNIQSPVGIVKFSQATGLLDLQYSNDRTIVTNSNANELTFGNVSDKIIIKYNYFELRDNNNNIVMSNKLNSTSNKFTTVFGSGADRTFSSTQGNNTPLSIVNSSGDNYSDCRFRLYNVDLLSTSTSPVIELIQQTGASSSEGAYLFKSANTKDFFIQDSRNIRIEPAYGACANFTTTKCLEFLNANSDIKGINSATSHPHNTTSRMRNIYCNEVVCVSPISQNNSISYKAFNSKYPLTSIRGLNESGYGPADDRSAMLELGVEQQTTANNNIYPIMRINSPAYADSEFYAYIQSNSNFNDYYGWAYSYSGVLDYYLEFNSNLEVISYQDLICKQDVEVDGTLTVNGNLIKPFGTFRIKHPIKAEADKDKYLYHSFVEAPRADNIYSGKIQLKNGKAIVNLDNNDYYKMTSGTFNKLNKDLRVYVNNNENFDRVIGKINGNKLNILCENNNSNAIIDWLIIGTRQDNEIKASSLTDDNGDLITETIEPPKDKDEDKDKNKTRKTKEIKKQDKMDRINHSHFKKLSKRLEKKTKINNGLDIAKKLIDTNQDKKKKVIKKDNTLTYELLNKNKNNI